MSYYRVTFPDVIVAAIAIITAELDPSASGTPHVGASVPTVRPARFLRVRRTGGSEDSLIVERPLLLVESWAENEPAAIAQGEQARMALKAARGTVIAGRTVYAVTTVSGLGLLPDPESGQARAVFTIELPMRGSAA